MTKLEDCEAALARFLKRYDNRLSFTVSAKDYEWLVNRVKKLEYALTVIGEDKFLCSKFGLNFEGYCLYARQAIKEES